MTDGEALERAREVNRDLNEHINLLMTERDHWHRLAEKRKEFEETLEELYTLTLSYRYPRHFNQNEAQEKLIRIENCLGEVWGRVRTVLER